MKRVTEQLTAYHAGQGLAGDDLSAAVAADLARVEANIDARANPGELSELFYWADSTEGHDYWDDRNAAA